MTVVFLYILCAIINTWDSPSENLLFSANTWLASL
jgi:hypothetical protein